MNPILEPVQLFIRHHNMPLNKALPMLDVIAKQNYLNLNRVRDFKQAAKLLILSINFN
jgi:hypothetical protein